MSLPLPQGCPRKSYLFFSVRQVAPTAVSRRPCPRRPSNWYEATSTETLGLSQQAPHARLKGPLGPSQRSLHNAPIFRLLLKVAVKGTHQCDLSNFCGSFGLPTSRAVTNERGGGTSTETLHAANHLDKCLKKMHSPAVFASA